MASYYLEIISGARVGKRFALAEGANCIGRGEENAISFPTEQVVSGYHAILYRNNDSFTIQDMSSTNGTYFEGQRIVQQELSVGQEFGFGEKGPRLRLIATDSAQPAESVAEPSTQTSLAIEKSRTQKTTYEAPAGHQTDLSLSLEGGRTPLPHTGSESSSLTMEFENKLLNKRMNVQEMQELLKDGKRMDKILQQGNLGSTQAHLLHTAYGVSKKSKKHTQIVLASVIAASVLAISFFAIKMFQYKSQVNKAVKLEAKLDQYEDRIAAAQAQGAGTQELATLISEFEQTKGKFDSAREMLKEDDFQQLFTDTVEIFISDILKRFGEDDYHIPPTMTERVKYHLNIYSRQLKPSITRYLQRKELYFPMINKIFREKNVPAELAYVSMLESGFNPKALSHAGARGLWQFMPHTGRRYGLIVDENLDERIIPEKATYAAAEYFKDLISIFGGRSSLMLAIAAYNAGEGRIMGALRKIDDPMRNRDFWYIYRMGHLAEETNEYIPRVLALMIIDEHPQHYGFSTGMPIDAAALESETDFIPDEKPNDQGFSDERPQNQPPGLKKQWSK